MPDNETSKFGCPDESRLFINNNMYSSYPKCFTCGKVQIMFFKNKKK